MLNRARAGFLGFLLIVPLDAFGQPGTLPAVPLSPPPNAPWFNTSLPVEQRAEALVSQMSLEEKGKQLVNRASAIPRLGVPAYNWWSEALHGVAIPGATTVFPEPVGLAASFDPALVHEMAVAISTEARVRYNRSGGRAFTPDSISGRPISTFSAIRAGGVARKLTAKIHSSLRSSVSRLSQACRVTIPSIPAP